MENHKPTYLPLSELTKPFDPLLKQLIEKYKYLWWETDASTPDFQNTYSRAQQKESEKELASIVNAIPKYLEELSHQKASSREIMQRLVDLSKDRLWNIRQTSGLYFSEDFNEGIKKSTKLFLEKIKQHDPSIELKYIYQAMRNLWIMNSLQLFLNLNMTCSDSMFAYSMLYPYTDNVMDDYSKFEKEKLTLHGKLKKWLEGEDCAQASEAESKIFTMVKLIENEFPRDKYPLVFPSVLTIFNAQLKSLIQQKKGSLPYENDILDISFEKGGTSVLADGFLLTGDMDEQQIDFCFCYGVFLQFVDDLQDVLNDLRNYQMTIFSQLAGKYLLDSLANKLLNFIARICAIHLTRPTQEPLKKILISNCYFLVLRSIGKNRQLFSKHYVQQMENFFPVSFDYYDHTKKKLTKVFRKYKGSGTNIDTLIELFTYLISDNLAVAA